MPQPAFSVRPASCTLPRMSSIESGIVPETVQLIVDVAGLCASRAGIGRDAPGRDRAVAHRPHEALVPVLAHVVLFRHRPAPGRRACRCRRWICRWVARTWTSADIFCPRCRARHPEREWSSTSWVSILTTLFMRAGAPRILLSIRAKEKQTLPPLEGSAASSRVTVCLRSLSDDRPWPLRHPSPERCTATCCATQDVVSARERLVRPPRSVKGRFSKLQFH